MAAVAARATRSPEETWNRTRRTRGICRRAHRRWEWTVEVGIEVNRLQVLAARVAASFSRAALRLGGFCETAQQGQAAAGCARARAQGRLSLPFMGARARAPGGGEVQAATASGRWLGGPRRARRLGRRGRAGAGRAFGLGPIR
jgi:hypothetical protein